MSIAVQAFKGATWLAIFKFASQLFSWFVTILIARILLPEDYGLYALAILITGYAEKFSQLGLGAAIIQRPNISTREISSVFWFAFFISVLFAVSCIPIAYVSAYIFDEQRIIPLTLSISILFILSGLQIVPISLLRKDLAFKKLGKLGLVGAIISGLSMLLIAYYGGGVWALLGGRLVLAFVMVILYYSVLKWFPELHFNFDEARSFIKFGVIVAIGGSFFYISENADRFFAGRELGLTALGYYSFALILAQIPTEKIVVLINSVAYPAFAKLQGNQDEFNKFYLQIVKVTGIIVMPIFFGGFMVGGDVIFILLGDKWRPIFFLFEMLCLTQIITALNCYNNFVHDARGKPKLAFIFNLISAVTMSIAFFIAAQYGLDAMLIPWFSAYLVICLIWIMFTLKQLKISLRLYINALASPVCAALLMSGSIFAVKYINLAFPAIDNYFALFLLAKISLGALVYIVYLWIFDRSIFFSIKNLMRPV